MDNNLNDVGVAEEVIFTDKGTARNQPQRGIKRSPVTVGGPPRKQQLASAAAAPASISLRYPRSSESVPENVTYRLVQLGGSTAGNVQQNQSTGAQIITTNGQNDFVTNSNQQILLNTSGGLMFATSAPQQSSPARLQAIAVAGSPNTTNQPMQLQTIEAGGQYYIMLPSGNEFMQTTPSTPGSISSTPARIVQTTPRIQQAAFIPLTRLESVQSTQLANNSVIGRITKQLDFQSDDSLPVGNGNGKEVKRRTSHNEVEKRRRDKINNWITKLARIVPNSTTDFGNSKTPQSKGGVLAKTADYIQELREVNDQLVDAIRHYESMSNCLKEDNKQLRNLLQNAGIEAPPELSFHFPDQSNVLGSASSTNQPTHSSSSPPTTMSSVSATVPTSATATVASTAIAVLSDADLPTTSTCVGKRRNNGAGHYMLVQTSEGFGLMRSGGGQEQNAHQQNEDEDEGDED